MMMRCTVLALVACAVVADASAQLRPDQVLVIYDSRRTTSRDVAEFYAGSALVPGGVGGLPGIHAGLHVFNLQTSGVPVTTAGNMTYADFITLMRDPIRDHLQQSGLTHKIRCIVLTKGLPHRIFDTDNQNVGDQPSNLANEFVAGDANCASVDSELTLLWQNLDAGENGGTGDSKSDGMIMNPYRDLSQSINAFSTINITTPKTWVQQAGTGRYWRADTNAPFENQLNPGDFYLVVRLDGHTQQDIEAMILRAQNLVYDVDNVGFVIDEANSDGVKNTFPNTELDNQSSPVYMGDDYECARDLLLTDGRFDPTKIHYNAASGTAQWIVGPNINYNNQGLLVTTPLILLAHYGSNHAGTAPNDGAGTSANDTYAASFNYAPGAIFNTLESFNARAFGPLDTRFNQEQVADFIAAGGTFGIGHCWEPLALGASRAHPLVANFILGRLSWAEAAYTALPSLSWQFIVVGDPLARARLSSDDINGDGRFDIEDLYAWNQNPTDLNRDGVADGDDLALLERSIRGTNYEDQGARDR